VSLAASQRWRSAAGWLAVLAALVPPLAYVQLIRTTGANAHSNDYLLWVPVIDAMASGHYPWANYFKDTLQSGCHSYAIPILVTAAIARFFAWSMDATLYLALGFSVLKLLLLHDALTLRAASWVRQSALVILSALIFAPAHVNTFTFGFSATHIGLTELGFVISLWGVSRFQGRWLGLSISCGGALLATWSWGSGLVAWPILAAALPLLGFRRPAHFALLAGCFALAVFPYLAYSDLSKAAPHGALPRSRAWLLLEAPGWPFSRNFLHGRARITGAITLLFIAGSLVWLRRGPLDRWRKAAPGLMCLAYSFGLMVPVAVLRGTLGQWYTSSFGFFWIGLTGLVALVIESTVPLRGPERLGSAAFGLATIILLATNGGYLHKAYYLQARSPAAETCLRNYRTAPPACELALFQWAGGHPEHIATLAEPLERHQWGAFAPQQQWTLQGDYLLDAVSLTRAPGASDVVWTAGLTPAESPVTDFRHLNLFLPAPGTITWPLTLPAGTRSAVFRTAVALSEAENAEARSAPVTFKVSLQRGDQHEELFTHTSSPSDHGWVEVEVPLTQFAGQPIAITLSSTAPGTAHPWAMFRFPVVDLELGPDQKYVAPQPLAPARNADDVVFDLDDDQRWDREHVTRDPNEPARWWVKWDPTLTYRPALDLCLDDYPFLEVTAAASPNTFLRHMQIFYRLRGDADFSEERSFRVPLYGGARRTYVAGLKLLGVPQNARLAGLRVDPIDGDEVPDRTWFEVSELRLVKGAPGPSRCSN
jgi:hypothetical protein